MAAEATARALAALDECLGGGRRLSLKGLGVSEVPEFVASQLGALTHLEMLDLSLNPSLRSLPDELSHLSSSLRTLFALGCGFEVVPEPVGKLCSLGMLSFKSNKLVNLGEDAVPASVHWLILTDNRLTALPRSIGALSGLRKLMLANNRIVSLPDDICKCTALELIRLSDNRLAELPAGLLYLPKLAWVALAGNPCVAVKGQRVPPPPEVSSSELEMLEEIGRGAGGTVHRAIWHRSTPDVDEASSLPLQVAVKIFRASATVSDGDPTHEVDASGAVSHQNMVRPETIAKCLRTPEF